MKPTDNQYWIFLEQLRRSGETNMYGAAPYLAAEFKIPMHTARAILVDWIEKYDPDDYRDVDYEAEDNPELLY